MPAPSLMVVWDYDTAIGQVNSSYPYNFHEESLIQEIENVDRILDAAARHDVRMTFACVGFAAEPGHYPYHVPEQIRRIRSALHEVASHSWRHEWFPFLDHAQVDRSLARSKQALETCIDEAGAVTGFVPPFSRPMTWYRKGAVSLGDRSLNPWRRGGNLGSLCRAARSAGYSWCRVSVTSLGQRLRGESTPALIGGPLERSSGVSCLPHHYTGFDGPALALLERAAAMQRSLVIVGHPGALSRAKAESWVHFVPFLDRAAELQAAGKLRITTVAEHLAAERALS